VAVTLILLHEHGRDRDSACTEGDCGQGVDKQAWEQFRASYHEFISHLEDAAGAAASVVDGIVQHRFDRLPA